jgi:RNA polymerase sigma-70 factor, ECF subfamily
MTDSDEDWDRWIRGLREGSSLAAWEFCERYGEVLRRVADKRLSPGIRRRVEPEDVVQSACRTFLRRVQGGEFELRDGAALWHLLCAITLTKVREQTRFHLRQKRGVDHEVAGVLDPQDSTRGEPGPASPGPTPAEAVAIADQLQTILEGLDEEERQLVDLKLQDLTNDQVAARMGCSERTVRRLLKRLESRLVREFEPG